MATKTSTETKREITRRGDLIIVKEVETVTTYAPGKDPEVKEVTRLKEYKGEEGYKSLPEDIRRQLEQPKDQKLSGPVNKAATRGNFAKDCLEEHNKYRKMHGVQPLKLSEELIQVSEKRAQELAGKDEMTSRTDHQYGENLSCLWSSDPEHFVQANEIVSRWYSEHINYNFDEEPKDLNAGHFTQMIWENCKEFGIAAAKSDSNKIYVVASYSPPGNYVNEFKKNVHPSGYGLKDSKSFFGIKFGSLKPNSSKTEENSVNSSRTDLKDVLHTDSAKLNQECVDCHNGYRRKHGVPPLKYSKELAKYAQQWADHLASTEKFEHRQERKYGENLYCFQSLNPRDVASPADACRSWYNEIEMYNFDTEPRSLDTGHFTQMVWKTTTEVGMGRAKANSGMQIIVANYNPPGNYIGRYRENVPKPIS